MREPNALISTEALARELGDSSLRVFDCTTYLEPPSPRSDEPYIAVPGRSSFETAHIPGADFLDLQGEFFDSTTRLRFMMHQLGFENLRLLRWLDGRMGERSRAADDREGLSRIGY